jgi:DNA invertase Pin-like site-specific DNA recombinase/predicted  nucleic acid-binding Zn-ribbon protein
MKRGRASVDQGRSAVPEVRRCAIYTRKSTSVGLEQDFNSLDAQREACERYIDNQRCLGWQLVPERYDDGGFTGANVERPAFTRLMQDVEARKIDVVVVYKVDRLSRSLLDFAKMMERFGTAGVSFVSVTQNFSTADAMGRLTLNMLMSFAEFERSMIAERTRDKINMARRHGKWTGGPTPLGYDLVEHKLVVNRAEAELVRRVYDLYLDKRSAVAVANALNAEHRTTKHQISRNGNGRGARAWDKNSVLSLLRSPIPAGLMSCGREAHEGEHEAIIDRQVYGRVQHLLDEGGKGHSWGRNPDYILTGLLRCARCGKAFTPASTRGREHTYRYYRCSTRDKRGRDACESGPLPAAAIEDFVIQRIQEELADGEIAAEVTRAVRERVAKQRTALQFERQGLPSKIAMVSTEGKRLVESASRITGTGRRLLDAKLQEVGDQLGHLEARLTEVQRRLVLLEDAEVEVEWVTSCLVGFTKIWDALSAENRGRLVRAIVTRVEVDEPNDDVRVYLADLGPVPEAETLAVEGTH